MARVSADQRRRDLSAAAIRVMMKVGVSATTTRLIADEAGVPQSVFHYCFRSKEELLQQLTREVVEGMVEDALSTVVVAESFEESVKRSMRGVFQNAAEQSERQLVLYELTTASLRDEDEPDLAKWQYEQYFESTRKILMGLSNHSEVEWSVPIDVLSRMVTTMIDGLILGWLADKNTEQAIQAMDLFSAQLSSLAVDNPAVVAGAER